MKKLKLMTILGTRPEIIRLSATIKKCDQYFDHILVHTGQNWDYALNQIFLRTWGFALQTTIWTAQEKRWAKQWGILLPEPMK